MGEPFLNIENVKKAIEKISQHYPNAHHYISTIGLKGHAQSVNKKNELCGVGHCVFHDLSDDNIETV